MLNFSKFARGSLGQQIGTATRYMSNTLKKIPDGLEWYGKRAYYIGTGTAEGAYQPGYWANLAHMTLNYMDPLSAPLLAAGNALDLTVQGVTRRIDRTEHASRQINDFAEWLHTNYEGWDINSHEDLTDFMRTTHREYTRQKRYQAAEQFFREFHGESFDFPQSDDIIRAKAPDSLARESAKLTSGVEWEFLLDDGSFSNSDNLINRLLNEMDSDTLYDEVENIINNSLDLDDNEIAELIEELEDFGVDYVLENIDDVRNVILNNSDSYFDILQEYTYHGSITQYTQELEELRERYPINIETDSTIEPGEHPVTGEYIEGYPYEVSTDRDDLTGAEALKLFKEFTEELSHIGAKC